MFIKTKNIKNKIVNLANVSNIYVDGNTEGKIIFNMNYSVKIFGDKITPDYVYWEFNSEEEKDELMAEFLNYLVDLGWIFPAEEGQRYVNSNCISSIGFDENRDRVIFNLNYNVTHPKDTRKLTSDFVFFNFSTSEKYRNFVDVMLGNRTQEEIEEETQGENK